MQSEYNTRGSPKSSGGMFKADCAQYRTVSLLGRSGDGSAVVHLAKHLPSGSLIAIKKFNLDRIYEDVDLVEHEIVLTRQLSHPHIISYLVAFVSGPEVYVVSPLMAYGSCKDLIVNHFTKGLPEVAIAHVLRDVLDALDYIHRKGFIHRAVRASHILVAASGRACLSGLRYACKIVQNGKWQRKIHSFPSSTAGNLNWLSPELLEQDLHGYNEKSDIYSVGITCCELANGFVPFEGMPSTLMLMEKVRGAPPQLYDCETYVTDELENIQIHNHSGMGDTSAGCSNTPSKNAYANRRFSEPFHQFTRLCLWRLPSDRPTAGQLLSHSFFKHCRRGYTMAELLHPVIPIGDSVADNPEDLASFETTQKLSEVDLHTYEWDF